MEHEERRDRRRERLLLVAIADNVFTAGLIRDHLGEAGIPCTVRNREGGVGVIGAIGGTFEVFVLEGDAARAAAVLGDGAHAEPLPPPALPSGPRPRRRRWWR